jgi:hypothetical protein
VQVHPEPQGRPVPGASSKRTSRTRTSPRARYVHDLARFWRAGDWRARDGFSYYRALSQVSVPVRAWVGAGDRVLSPPAEARGLVSPVRGVLDHRVRPVWDDVASFVLSYTPSVARAPW